MQQCECNSANTTRYRGVGGSEITPVDTDRVLSGIGGGGEYRGEVSRLGDSVLDFLLVLKYIV